LTVFHIEPNIRSNTSFLHPGGQAFFQPPLASILYFSKAKKSSNKKARSVLSIRP